MPEHPQAPREGSIGRRACLAAAEFRGSGRWDDLGSSDWTQNSGSSTRSLFPSAHASTLRSPGRLGHWATARCGSFLGSWKAVGSGDGVHSSLTAATHGWRKAGGGWRKAGGAAKRRRRSEPACLNSNLNFAEGSNLKAEKPPDFFTAIAATFSLRTFGR